MQLGLVGLGKMGGNMRERIRRAGHEVVGGARVELGREGGHRVSCAGGAASAVWAACGEVDVYVNVNRF